VATPSTPSWLQGAEAAKAGFDAHGANSLPAGSISFVIPAYNEEKFIARTLRSIHEGVDGRWSYEIVVVDNGSSDRTVEVARAHHANVIGVKGDTIAHLRNEGAAKSSGQVLVFLDADVVLTHAWEVNIGATLQRLKDHPRLVTGSACGVPEDSSWLERNWFGPQQNGRSAHINSGHLVVNAAFFRELGGFDEELETGEDYDLSMRALSAGGRLESNPALAVVHLGFPRTLRAFVQREAWHGRGDFASVRSALHSPVAIATISFVLLHVLLLAMAVSGFLVGAVVALTAIAAVCLSASARQYKGNPLPLIAINAGIYYLYFWGRALALMSVLAKRNVYVHRDRR